MTDEAEHEEALEQTGFWGRQGAGCILYARSTGRFLLGLRSDQVEEPGTWGTWGGAVSAGTGIEESVRMEVLEETGYCEPIELYPLCEFIDATTGFRYQNYLGVIDNEFTPALNWESAGFGWFDGSNWPNPKHFGLKHLLDVYPDPAAVDGRGTYFGRKP